MYPLETSGSLNPQNGSAGVQLSPEARAFALVVALFFLSGFSSLIYQVVWMHLLVLVFGSTTFATSTVLAVFMGGLALGSYVAGKFVDRIKRPFLCYGILEGIIGLWALLVPILFTAAIPLYIWVWQAFHFSLVPFSLLRLAIAAIILILPTSMMGATLPLLAKFITNNLDYVGRKVGTLYAVNTMGAVGGAAAAGFVLLPTLGRHATTVIAAIVNFVLCIIALRAAKFLEKSGSSSSSAQTVKPSTLPPAQRVCLIAFALSGAVAMVYEVGWTRALLMVIGSTTYAFTCMLASYLVGIFIGSLVCARFVDRAKEPLVWFCILEVLVCAFSLLSLHLFNYLPYWNIAINAFSPYNAMTSLAVRLVLSSCIMLPTALCLGAIFPVVVKSCVKELDAIGRSVGMLYSANTVGAIIGAFLSGFLLVPWLGVERMLMAASVANLVIAVMILYLIRPISMAVKCACSIVAIMGIAWCFHVPNLWDRAVMLFAQTERRRLGFAPKQFRNLSFAHWKDVVDHNATVLFWKDGVSSTVGVSQIKKDSTRTLITNGHIDGSDVGDMPVQVLLAGYPLLFKGDAREIGVVGWGTGVMVGTALQFPIKSITAVELEPAVIESSSFFHHVNHAAENDPRVHLEINDGRNYLLASDKQFDIIVSEPSNPWQAGVCNLFTREYFDVCHKRLNKGGILSLWLQTDEIHPENMKGILAALHSVFPYITALMVDDANVAILASDKPLKVNFQNLERQLANPVVLHELGRVGVRTAVDLIARIGFTSDGMDELTRGASLNVDDTNRLEYQVARTYENGGYNEENRSNFVEHTTGPWKVVSFENMAAPQKAMMMAKVAEKALSIGRPSSIVSSWAAASLAVAPNAEAYVVLGILQQKQGHKEAAGEMWKKALQIDPRNMFILKMLGEFYMRNGELANAYADFLKVYAINPEDKDDRYRLAQIIARYPEATGISVVNKRQQAEGILKYLGTMLNDSNFVAYHPQVLSLAAIAYHNIGRYDQAEVVLRRYLVIQPTSISACRHLSDLLSKRGANAEARKWLIQADKQAEGR